MSRITTSVLVFLVLFNGAISIADASGLSEDLGVSPNSGVDEELDSTVTHAQDGFAPNATVVDTLINLFLAAISLINTLLEGVFAAPAMFMNLGFPSWIVVPIFAPMYIIAVLEVMYVGTGRDMV